jgi:hypothetical protein
MPQGIRLVPAYVGSGKELTGSSRLAQEARERAEALGSRQEDQRRQKDFERKRLALQVKIQLLQAEFAAEEEAMKLAIREDLGREQPLESDRHEMARNRGVGRGRDGDSRSENAAGGSR